MAYITEPRSMTTGMRALRVACEGESLTYIYGDLKDAHLEPLEGQYVVVKISTASIRPLQKKVVEFIAENSASCKNFPACTDFCGKVVKIGSDVTRFNIDETVCGILSILSDSSACSGYCVVHELDIVKVPLARTETEAVSCIGPAVKAYTSLIYHANLKAKMSVLVISGASPDGLVAIQLALSWGSKVITTVCGDDERRFVEKNYPDIGQVIDIGSKNSSLVSIVMEETGSLGVDIILDDGVKASNSQSEPESTLSPHPSKHSLISCLAVNGKWITTQPYLQLDPPESMLLFMRNASIGFSFPYAWILSKTQHGRYLHILTDVMNKLASGVIRSHVTKTVQFSDAVSVFERLPERPIGATVMHMM